MTPTNPAAPPAAPVLEHPAMVARRVSVPGVLYDEGGRMIEAYAQARVDAATRELREQIEIQREALENSTAAALEMGKRWADAREALERTIPR